MKRVLLSIAFPLLCLGITAQANYDYSRLCTEKLDRGVVAVRQPDGKVFVSWRILRDDAKGEAFDVYRNGEKLNKEPLTTGGSYFIDEHPIEGDATYDVKKSGKRKEESGKWKEESGKRAENGGDEQNISPSSFLLPLSSPTAYIPIAINKPDGRYTANDASVGDVDGDGQYEIILKWEPWNAHDNAHDGMTDPTLFDCYRLNGEHLWRINMGRNIRSGAHYVPFIVYDLDGDGRAELMVKTADGTRDGQGTVIGDSLADYRNEAGRILSGPEFISVFDGLTGRVLDTKPYIPERGELRAWGDSKGNRSERYLAAVGYLGGKLKVESGKRMEMASAIFCRGYYTRSVLAAWDWDGKELKQRWVFDTNNKKWSNYAGQGNHNLRVADVDGDGFDEITYGSMAVDHDGTGLYNTRMGHGDAIHLVVNPKDNRLFIWDCHENKRDGSELRDARTGKVVFQIPSASDVGRCMAADIDPTSPGMEMWSADSHGIRSMKGEETHPQPLPVRDGNNYSQPSVDHEVTTPLRYREGRGGGSRISINFGIWWDGDLLRELLDRSAVTKYDWENHEIKEIMRFDGQFNNGTKSNPCLSADILGDWREEVIVRNRESTELRIYVSTIPTPYRINCLMQDIPYRLSVGTQNVEYNQPSEPGFYLGPDGTDYLK